MQDTQSQDRLAGALSYILFFIPHMMDHRTEYTCFHMKQAFLLNVIGILSLIVSIPVISSTISFIVFIHIAFLGWKAYNGVRLAVPYVYPYAEKLITLISLQKWFMPKI